MRRRRTGSINPRTIRDVRRGKAERLVLIEKLGGRCVWCGETRISRLELDHIDGRDWIPRQVASHTRVVRYRREAAEGKLQVLCKSCNALKGNYEEKPKVQRARVEEQGQASLPEWITEGEPLDASLDPDAF